MPECATCICTDMKPPDEMPETEVSSMSMFSAGNGPGGAARAPPARTAEMRRTAARASGGRVGANCFMIGLRQEMRACLHDQHSAVRPVRGWGAPAMR